MADVIHLLRHGEVHNPDNVCYADIEGFGLSSLGRAQARSVGDHLRSLPTPPLAAFSSPLLRARQTFQETGLILDLTILDGLTEWGLAQRWKGERWDQLDELFPGEVDAYWRDPTKLEFSPESLRDLASRMTGAISAAANQVGSGAVIFVSHQDPVQAARLALTGRPLTALHEDKPAHGSLITLSRDDHSWIELAHWRPDQG